ncbi:hypothetical protein AMTRI_Chr03g146580 [Amborella trichopoda]
MARPPFSTPLLLLLLLLCIAPLLLLTSASSDQQRPSQQQLAAATSFIRASCRTTRYPALCVSSLSAYAPAIRTSPRQLAHAALSVSLTRAKSTSSFVAKLGTTRGLRAREAGAIRDCVENMGDSVDEIKRSLGEMGRVGGGTFQWRMSNVQTWVSAALTNENTCVDGFQGVDGSTKSAVKARIQNVAQVTSNALALVNCLAAPAP